jgi:hypothetical protein
MYTKIKKGATSLIVTMFFTLLAGILVLSFISIMLSNINESTNYNLSQSAYDAALAGIEDAKVMLLEYKRCIARNDTHSSRCENVVKAVEAVDSEENCDIVREALGRATTSAKNETLIRTDNSAVDGVDASFDMAYTCVKVSQETSNYLGIISSESDTKVIPLRTRRHDETDQTSLVDKVRIEWYSNDDFSAIKDNGLLDNYVKTLPTYTFTNGKFSDSSITNDHNAFNTVASLPVPINVGLIQAGASFKLADFNTPHSGGTLTNRGRLTLRPVSGRTAGSTTTIARDAFAKSTYAADKDYNNSAKWDNDLVFNAANSPIDVKCHNHSYTGTYTYACSATILLPQPYDATGALDAQDGFRFLTLSSPYADPDISFSITMLNAEDKTVDFIGVQSSVDSTGRANDLFRRIDARVELIDTGYPFPKYTLAVYGDGTNYGSIVKNYRATFNCWKINNGNNIGCDNNYASDGEANGGFTDS